MRNKKVNIVEIAHIANVHPSTVSRALNNSSLVNEKTRKWIQSIAASAGYIPDVIAKSLHSGQTSIIGIIVPEISNSFYSHVIDAIEQNVSRFGYDLILSGTHFDPTNEIHAIQTMLGRQVDALVVFAPSANATEFLNTFRDQIPIVLADTVKMENMWDSVYVDEHAGIHAAIQHLKVRGYSRVGCIADHVTARRLDVFTSCLRDNGLEIYPSFLYRGQSFGVECGYEGMLSFAKKSTLPDAIFATRDNVAIGIMRAIIEMNIAIPQQIGIVGYDDISSSNYLYKKLTTVHQPTDRIGESVSNLLLDRLQRNSVKSEDVSLIRLVPQLVIREST